jgi:hypothetical protein
MGIWQERGLAIASSKTVKKNKLGWQVPSQSGNGTYIVSLEHGEPFCEQFLEDLYFRHVQTHTRGIGRGHLAPTFCPLTPISPSRGERTLKSPLPPFQKGGLGEGTWIPACAGKTCFGRV